MERENRLSRLLRRADVLVLLCVALLAALLWLAGRIGASPGAGAVVTTPQGEEYVDLSRDKTWTVTGRDAVTVIVQVEDGRIRFQASGCPDQICVKSGWLSEAGQTAACVPAGVSIRVTGNASVDMIAG